MRERECQIDELSLVWYYILDVQDFELNWSILNFRLYYRSVVL
jgi:hypothetical protein